MLQAKEMGFEKQVDSASSEEQSGISCFKLCQSEWITLKSEP
uniref:Pheromone n=1 Tax=Peronospora matthiolae TaxID=2874970 RepID=A0AAV1VBT4_9STRA